MPRLPAAEKDGAFVWEGGWEIKFSKPRLEKTVLAKILP